MSKHGSGVPQRGTATPGCPPDRGGRRFTCGGPLTREARCAGLQRPRAARPASPTRSLSGIALAGRAGPGDRCSSWSRSSPSSSCWHGSQTVPPASPVARGRSAPSGAAQRAHTAGVAANDVCVGMGAPLLPRGGRACQPARSTGFAAGRPGFLLRARAVLTAWPRLWHPARGQCSRAAGTVAARRAPKGPPPEGRRGGRAEQGRPCRRAAHGPPC